MNPNYKRILFFLVTFGLMNLAFIPLMSIYGLRVCPILQPLGFKGGCFYTGAFISVVSLVNFVLVLLTFRRSQSKILSPANIAQLAFGSYIFASLLALAALQLTFKTNHLTDLGRAPEILILSSLMLGTTQSYGLVWAVGAGLTNPSKRKPSIDRLWLFHLVRSFMPIFITLGVCIHFLISQSVDFNEGKVAPIVEHDALIEHTSILLFVLMIWTIVTLSFFLLAERDSGKLVKRHAEELDQENFDYKTPEQASWGLWSFIISTLNGLSNSMAERKGLETELIETSKLTLLGEVTGNLAHEIRNPMTIILGKTAKIKKMMTNDNLPKDELAKCVAVIEQMIARQNGIIDSVRELTHSGVNSQFEEVLVREIFKVVEDLVANKAAQFGVRVSFKNIAENAVFLGKRIQLSQVLINLISNSIDAISEFAGQSTDQSSGKWVQVNAYLDGAIITIDVVDSGKGIPESIASQLFHKNVTTKSVGKGTGLGLKLCKKIVESHEGNITVVSGTLNTTFRIQLPKANAFRMAA